MLYFNFYQTVFYLIGEIRDGLTGRVLARDAESMYLMDESQLFLFRLRKFAVEKEMEDRAIFAIFRSRFSFYFLEFRRPFLHYQSATTILASTGKKRKENTNLMHRHLSL